MIQYSIFNSCLEFKFHFYDTTMVTPSEHHNRPHRMMLCHGKQLVCIIYHPGSKPTSAVDDLLLTRPTSSSRKRS
jgi:hypothetical protein